MGKSGIGDSFKERLGQHEAPIDHDQLIADMGLGSEDRRRLVIWIILASLLLGMTASGFFYGWDQNVSEQLSLGNNNETQVVEFEDTEYKKTIAPETNASVAFASEKNTEKTIQNNKDENQVLNPLNSMSSPTQSKLSTNNKQSKTPISKSQSSVSNQEHNIDQFETTVEDAINQVLLEVTPEFQSTENTFIHRGEDENKQRESLKSASDSSINSRVAKNIGNFQKISKDKENSAVLNQERNPRTVLNVESLEKANLKLLLLDIPALSRQQVITSLQEKRHTKWSFVVQSEVFAFGNSFTTNTIENTEYAQLRSSLENPLEGFSNEALFHYNISNFLYLKSGIQYNRYNRSFSYQENFTQTVEKDIVTDIKVTYFGDTITTSELMSSEENVNRNWTRHQHLSQINMPLYLGVCKPIGRWNTYVEAGIQINLFQWFEGLILDENYAVVSNADIYRSNFANQASLAAGLVYKLNRRTGIDCGIRYGRSLNSTTKDVYSLDESIQQLGFRMGVKYKL